MKITKKELGEKILAYLNRKVSLGELVNWAEEMVSEGEYEDRDFEKIRDILAHLGLADVKEFGLSWDDCYNYLSQLGYKVKIEVVA